MYSLSILIFLASLTNAAPAPLRLPGQCGLNLGSCSTNYCCSQYGWCGTTAAYCSIGCQPLFGKCSVSVPTTTTTTSSITSSVAMTTSSVATTIVAVPSSLPISTTGQCSQVFGMCPDNLCCSQYGWCGTTVDHCNNCNNVFSGNNACGKSGPVSQFNYIPQITCDVNNSCPDGYCCGSNGKCGTTNDYCKNSIVINTSNPSAVLVKSCKLPNTIAITIDDGPQTIGQISSLLNKNNIKATFFINGDNFNSQQDIDVINAYNSGHQIASHTWSHADLTTLSYTEIIDEILRLDNYLLNLIGKAPRYFRFPYLSYNSMSLTALGHLNKITVDISVDSLDWKYNNVNTEMNLIQTGFNNGVGNGFIQLSHEFPSTTLDFLTQNIDFWKSKNYTFVTIEQCIQAGSAYT